VGAALAQGTIQLYYWKHRSKQTALATPEQAQAVSETPDGEEATENTVQTTSEVSTPSLPAMPFFLASIFANNFPDLDLFVTLFTEPRLGYILHHRGHTHTFLFVILQWFAIMAGFWGYARWKGWNWQKDHWKWLGGLVALGGFVHIGMDSWNVYGVHPLWPFDNRWYYGDFVFIIEPLIWLSLIPWLLAVVQRRWTRNLLIFFYGLSFVALSVAYLGIWWYPLTILVLAFSYGFTVRFRLPLAMKALVSISTVVLVLMVLLIGSRWSRATLVETFERGGKEKVLDLAIMSYPSNPFCVGFISTSLHKKTQDYIARRGTFSLWPKVMDCPVFERDATAPVKQLPIAASPKVGGFIGKMKTFRKPRAELLKLENEHCRVRAILQFVRSPYWKITKHAIFFGDLRFDRRKGLDFSDFQLRLKPKNCPTMLPPWIPPTRTSGLLKK